MELDEHDLRARIETLGREVYGDEFEKFLATPRRFLDWESPRALVDRGEYERVLRVLERYADGDFDFA